MEWGTPVQWGKFLLFCVPQSVKIKETYPTRPGSPTPCKQALRSFWKFHVVVGQNNGKELYQKNCAARAKFLLLIRLIVVFHRFPKLHAFPA